MYVTQTYLLPIILSIQNLVVTNKYRFLVIIKFIMVMDINREINEIQLEILN